MLREYLIGEAMHGLGIPTTRALPWWRPGSGSFAETALPGAVLCRIAASHLRVGTFQYAAATGDRDLCGASPTTPSPATTRTRRGREPYLALSDAWSRRRPRSSRGGCSSASSTA